MFEYYDNLKNDSFTTFDIVSKNILWVPGSAGRFPPFVLKTSRFCLMHR
jgi:hypothetical protein